MSEKLDEHPRVKEDILFHPFSLYRKVLFVGQIS